MEIFMTGTATNARWSSAALTRVATAVAYPSLVQAPVCPSADLSRDKAHNGQGGHPPRGSEALH